MRAAKEFRAAPRVYAPRLVFLRPVCLYSGSHRRLYNATLATNIRLLFAYNRSVPERWCTVCVTDSEGRRHSLDLLASSVFDAAHIYVCHTREHPERGLPRPTLATAFEVVIDGRALQRWIVQRREEWNGPRGHLFRQRPGLE